MVPVVGAKDQVGTEDQVGAEMAAAPNPTPTSPATTAIARATTLATVRKAPSLVKSECTASIEPACHTLPRV